MVLFFGHLCALSQVKAKGTATLVAKPFYFHLITKMVREGMILLSFKLACSMACKKFL